MAKKESGNFHFIALRRLLMHGRRENITANRSNDVESGIYKSTNTEAKTSQQNASKTATSDKNNQQQTTTITTTATTTTEHEENETNQYCTLCYIQESASSEFFALDLCQHRFCLTCLVTYLINEINESRTDMECPQCPSAMHPNNIEHILKEYPHFKGKYEDFMIRRYLVSDPDSRWCPAPDCSYAVIAAGCASCPEIHCEHPECGISFCYHCKAEWHPNQTCDTARNLRQKAIRKTSATYSEDSTRRDDIKPCPRCQILIVKMNDGSCNHMVCSVCGAEFCWLCMKEVSDLHYLSPSGCTFWGKKPWSRKKKIIWQIGTLVGAPVGIALLAGIAVPSMVIGIPVWVGRKLFERYKTKSKKRRNITVAIGVTTAILLSPFLAGFTIAIGIPILLFYVYGVVPVSLCRAGCGAPNDDFNFEDCSKENCSQPNSNSDGTSLNVETSLGNMSSTRATNGSLTEVAAIAKNTTAS